MNIIKNERGSLLLIVFTVAVVFGLVSLSLMSMMSSSKVNEVRRSDYEAYTGMLASLRSQVEDPLQCYHILGGLKAPTTLKALQKNLVLKWNYGDDEWYNNKTNSTTKNLMAGVRIPYTKVEVEDVYFMNSGALKVKNKNGVSSSRLVNIKTGASLQKYRTVALRLHVSLKGMGVGFITDADADAEPPESIGRLVRRENEIRVLANIDTTGKIYNCFGFQSSAAICQMAGGAFNHLGPADLRCQPDLRCFTTGALRLDTACPSPYKAFQVGLTKKGVKQFMCRLCREDL